MHSHVLYFIIYYLFVTIIIYHWDKIHISFGVWPEFGVWPHSILSVRQRSTFWISTKCNIHTIKKKKKNMMNDDYRHTKMSIKIIGIMYYCIHIFQNQHKVNFNSKNN